MRLRLANETDCRIFKFWFEGEIREGIAFKQDLFDLSFTFSGRRRDQAYDLATQLVEAGIATLVVCASDRYRVCISLNSSWWRLEPAKRQTFIGDSRTGTTSQNSFPLKAA